MSDLIAIGYPDEATAEAAAEEARRLARDLIIEPDAIAVIVRDKEGKYHVHTQHHLVGSGATWGMFWGLPAERERIRQRVLHLRRPRAIGNDIQIALRIQHAVIGGGRQHAIAQGQDSGYRFQRRRRA